MGKITGFVAEQQLSSGEEKLLISCPEEAVPAAGQYLLAAEHGAIQATPLFPAGYWKRGFTAISPVSDSWRPGTELTLFGPLGHGFHLPGDVQRLVLVGLGNTNSRLLPVLNMVSDLHTDITLFSDAPLSELPPDLEAFPLQDLTGSLTWADFFVIDAPIEKLVVVFSTFDNSDRGLGGVRGQVLVHTSMPCCGLGDCGVCAVKINHSWRLACEAGPVFDLPGVLKGIGW